MLITAAQEFAAGSDEQVLSANPVRAWDGGMSGFLRSSCRSEGPPYAIAPPTLLQKIAEMLKPDDMQCPVKVIYQKIADVHRACPKNPGDWYFSGNYPTKGGAKVRVPMCPCARVLPRRGRTTAAAKGGRGSVYGNAQLARCPRCAGRNPLLDTYPSRYLTP